MIKAQEQQCIARIGYVRDYDAIRHMARVEFPELGMISSWLPVGVSMSLGTQVETPMRMGDHVLCIMLGTGTESGVVVCAFYDDTNRPPLCDSAVTGVTFDDTTYVSYDKREHKLIIDCTGDVEVTGVNVRVNGSPVARIGDRVRDGVIVTGAGS